MFENPEGEPIRDEVVVNLDDDKGTTFGALRQGTRGRLSKVVGLLILC